MQILLVAGSSVWIQNRICVDPSKCLSALFCSGWKARALLPLCYISSVTELGCIDGLHRPSAVLLLSVPRHVAAPFSESPEEKWMYSTFPHQPLHVCRTFLLRLGYSVALMFVLIFLRRVETRADQVRSPPGLSNLSRLLIN